MAKANQQLSADVGAHRQKYEGAAWRSRFLRAPKTAIELAVREDFVPLGSLATFKLGLKTGADDFFFLQPASLPKGEDHGDMIRPSAGLIRMRGKDGWVGTLSKDDLVPAIVGPHEFIGEQHRRFSVKKKTIWYYLHPKPGRLRGQLADYIRVGEMARVHEKNLVKSNASVDAWYTQVRGIIRSRWALPYNSAYEYGAWDNSVGAILNGRFVGVEPLADVSDDVLGAVMLSSFALIGRLTEGMSTGSEGAFDVGPPAARKIRVPDVRSFSRESLENLEEIISEVRASDKMIPAPTSGNRVALLRRKLDIGLLMGLGASAGQSAALVDRLYESYARWRGDIEKVEDDVQANKRAVTRSGQGRDVQPAEAAGRRVWEEVRSDVRLFPRDVLAASEPVEHIVLPPGALIPETRPLFDEGLVAGLGRRRVDLKSYDRVRYLQMLRKIGANVFLPIPHDSIRAGLIATAFDQELESLRARARDRCKIYLSSPEAVSKAVRQTEKMWLSACRATIEEPLGPDDSE